MNGWSFRGVMLTLILSLSLASVGGLGASFVGLFSRDRTRTLMDSEISTTRKLAAHILSLVALAEVIEPGRVADTKEIIFLIEDPCRTDSQPGTFVSSEFRPRLEAIGLDPLHWKNSIEVFRACELEEQGDRYRFIQSGAPFMVPYLLVLIPGEHRWKRLAMVSMDGYRSATRNTVFLAGPDGVPVWAADGMAYLEGAMADVQIGKDVVKNFVGRAFGSAPPGVEEAGLGGWISYAPLAAGQALLSLSYTPEIMRSVWFGAAQIGLLVAGFLFLCLFVGKLVAARLSFPFEELMSEVDRVGKGDFSGRMEEAGIVEFARLKGAFNLMNRKVGLLLEETRSKAAMEKEVILAQGVQKMLLPPQTADFKGHSVSGIMRAAHYVGGDWWGVKEVDRPGLPPILILCVGDATDHGVSPALVAATVKGAHTVLTDQLAERYRKGEGQDPDPAAILGAFHRTILDAAQGTISMTMVLAILDQQPDPAKSRLIVANAGHANPYLLPHGQPGRMIGGTGSSLGVQDGDFSVEVEEFPWMPGDRIVLYTDGLIENFRGDANVFSRKTLSKMLRNLPSGGARDALRRILAVWTKETQGIPQADDVTVVVCEAKFVEERPGVQA